MVALYRDGRQADALATYKRVRTWLSDELGLDPGLQLQQLEQQILSHDASLGVPSSTGRGLGPEAPVGNLPSISVELVGREAELTAVSDLLANNRLVEIVGPGGVGKTALAIATGRQLSASEGVERADVWLARLETAVTADDVIDTLVAALNVGSEAALFERLKRSSALVILDNCEHVVDAAAALAVRLLDAAPRCASCAPARFRSMSTVKSCTSSHRSRSPTLSRCSRVEPAPNARRGRPVTVMTPCTSCADHSMVSPSRSNSRRRGRRHCRSRRSPAVSTIGSSC